MAIDINPDLDNNNITDKNPNSVNSELNNNNKPAGPLVDPALPFIPPFKKPKAKAAPRFGRRK
jgi:hypothetical protein